MNYFNFDSLERTLRRCGFEPRMREATFPMEWFLLQGIDYIGRDDIGRKCHAQRMALEKNLEATGLSHVRRGSRAGWRQGDWVRRWCAGEKRER